MEREITIMGVLLFVALMALLVVVPILDRRDCRRACEPGHGVTMKGLCICVRSDGTLRLGAPR